MSDDQKDSKPKGVQNPPADSDKDFVSQKKRLDGDVAGHEANFKSPSELPDKNVRADAEAQIQANYADHQAPDAVQGKPELNVKGDKSDAQAEADKDADN